MTPEQAAALRKPFPKESIGRLPKGGVMLDYCGHAVVTDRLLSVDPAWTWEPLALDAQGLPAFDKAGNLWIRMTVCGVTRVGVGDGKSAKEAIGDAIRNCAMRFGVALDLWSKEELEGSHEEAGPVPPTPEERAENYVNRATSHQATVDSLRALFAAAKDERLLNIPVRDGKGGLVDLGTFLTERGKALAGAA